MGGGPSKRTGNGGVGRRHSWAARQDTPTSLYKSFGGSFNQLRCVMHELGSKNKCRSEDYLKQKGRGAIVGLHSNWIGDFILACARPSDRIIEDHHLIHQFLTTIFHGRAATSWMKSLHWLSARLWSLTLPEEGRSHGLDDGGGQVAVHCHSGIGRTGLLVACQLLYSGAYNAPFKAIQAVREDRPGTFQSKNQLQLVKIFHSYICTLRIQFVPLGQRRKRFINGEMKSYPTLVESMVRQNEYLYGAERQSLHYVPKVLDWLTRDLIRRTEFDRDKREQIAMTFMTVFTMDLNLSPHEELVKRAKGRINAGDWKGVEELETPVLCYLLLEWLCQLQEPIVPDSILTTALGRGDIESAIDELAKCDQSSFATLQCLVCWLFQMVPVQPKLIRRLYSAMAHVLLANTTLQTLQSSSQTSPAGQSSPETNPNPVPRQNPLRRPTVHRMHDVYTKFKPSQLEIEFGLLLEAAARFWIKLGVAKHEEIENQKKQAANTPQEPSEKQNSSPMPASLGSLALKMRDKHRLGSFSQPWFRDRSSLQYEQYNPGMAAEVQREMERGSIGGGPPTRFVEQKPKRVILPIGEQKLKGAVVQEEKKKPAPQVDTRKPASQEEVKPVPRQDEKTRVPQQESKKPSPQVVNRKPVSPAEKNPIAQEGKNKPAPQVDNRKHTSWKEQSPEHHQEKKNPIAQEDKQKPLAREVKKVGKGILKKPT